MAFGVKAVKNIAAHLVTGGTDVYTCPSEKTAIVLCLQVTNVDGAVSADATVSWTDASQSGLETCLVKSCPIPAGGALNILAGKLVLESGDSIKAKASADNKLVLTGSVVEMG